MWKDKKIGGQFKEKFICQSGFAKNGQILCKCQVKTEKAMRAEGWNDWDQESEVHIRSLDPTETLSSLYWVCGTKAYRSLPTNLVESCYPSWLLPPTKVVKTVPPGQIRNYRMLMDTRMRKKGAPEWRQIIADVAAEAGQSIVR